MMIIDKLPVAGWEKYRELRLRAIKENPGVFVDGYENEMKLPPEEWKNRLKQVAEGKKWMVFAKDDNRLVGMMAVVRSPADMENNSSTLCQVYLEQAIRGKGIADELLIKLLGQLKKGRWWRKWFDKSGVINSIHLFVEEHQTRAIKFYERVGFVKFGKDIIKMGDGKEHLGWLMKMEKIL